MSGCISAVGFLLAAGAVLLAISHVLALWAERIETPQGGEE